MRSRSRMSVRSSSAGALELAVDVVQVGLVVVEVTSGALNVSSALMLMSFNFSVSFSSMLATIRCLPSVAKTSRVPPLPS